MIPLEGMAEVFDAASRVASHRMPVLVQGETGVGKELVARHIHHVSERSHKPFVAFNCGSVPESLFASTLFGHVKGAFTSADHHRAGLIEAAHGGTLFLDEIGELPLSVQPALLRALDTYRIRRIGSTEEMDVDFRLVTATHRDLSKMCRRRNFREDLLHRINGFHVVIPPLRERRGDIGPLVDYFLHGSFQSYGSYEVSKEAMGLLLSHDWPGNARELRHVVEAAIVLARKGRIEVEHLRFWSQTSAKAPQKPRAAEKAGAEPAWISAGLNAHLEAVEAQAITDALIRTGGNQQEAANLLKIPLRTFAYRLHRIRAAGLVEHGTTPPAEGPRRNAFTVPTPQAQGVRGGKPLM